jgi:hypothetical protein
LQDSDVRVSRHQYTCKVIFFIAATTLLPYPAAVLLLLLFFLQSVVALITTDVHNRDVVTSLLSSGVTSVSDFGWQMQLRFDYDTNTDSIMARQVNAR